MVISGVVLFLLYGDWEEFGWFFVLYFVDFLFVMVRYVELKDLFMILCFYLILFNLLLIIWKGYKKCNLICYILVFNELILLLRCRRKFILFLKWGLWWIFFRKFSWEDELCICLCVFCRCFLDWLYLSCRLLYLVCSFFKELLNFFFRIDFINGKLFR